MNAGRSNRPIFLPTQQNLKVCLGWGDTFDMYGKSWQIPEHWDGKAAERIAAVLKRVLGLEMRRMRIRNTELLRKFRAARRRP